MSALDDLAKLELLTRSIAENPELSSAFDASYDPEKLAALRNAALSEQLYETALYRTSFLAYIPPAPPPTIRERVIRFVDNVRVRLARWIGGRPLLDDLDDGEDW